MWSPTSALRVRALFRQRILGHSTQQIFARMYRRNSWGNAESASGDGSDLAQTRIVRKELAGLMTRRNIEALLDAPCGDYHWMQSLETKPSQYIGADIVPELIEANQRTYGSPSVRFLTLDISKDPLPRVDLIFCRDCLVHLPLQVAVAAVRNFKRSGSRYLLTTTYPRIVRRNKDLLITGNWRPLDLTRPPFALPEPLELINEGCTEEADYPEKSLGLWDLQKVRI